MLRQTTVVIWTLLAGIGLATVLSLAPGIEANRLVYFGLATLTIQWITLGSLATLYALHAPLSRLPVKAILPIALLVLVMMTVIVHLLAGWILGAAGQLPGSGWHATIARAAAIALTVGLLGLAALQNHLRVQSLALQAKQAELQALQARTHPHFLFNTLNTGAALIHARPDAAEQLLLDLADLFRAALTGPGHISLQAEIDLVQRYLSIEQLRLGERLRVTWDVPDPLPSARVPSLSLQPLTENAVRHGIERRIEGGNVHIRIRVCGNMLELSVTNEIASDEASATPGHGVGLASVEQRIREMTDGAGSLTTSVVDGRFHAAIRLPDQIERLH